MEINVDQLFKNMKSLPPKGTLEFNRLVDFEVEKCIGGITIDGVHIPGWLYWHTNHWHIRVDGKDKFDNIVRIKSLPFLRDNEWIRADALEQCRVRKEGYMEIGLRQGGKSELEASFCAYNAVMFEETQNVIVGGNDADLALLKDKIDFGLKNLWEGIAIPRLDKTWRGSAIRLGFKLKNGDDKTWSTIIIRNADDGKNTETAAGTTAKSYIMDEVGKYPFAAAFEAAKPAFLSAEGWRAIPILVGTGGSFEKGQDAANLFYNPTANRFLAFKNAKGKETCLFMPGTFRMDFKHEMGLGDYLAREQKIEKATEQLNQIRIMVSDVERATREILKERERLKSDPDQTKYLKSIMYYPLTEEECFLTQDKNIFNVRTARAQQQKLYDNQIEGTNVFLFQTAEGIRHEFTDKRPITAFPARPIDDKDAPIQIWEFPVRNPPFGLYVAGVDPYRHASSAFSDSLGAVYIYKRIHNILGEEFQDTFVAAYVARPDDKDKWNEQARLLIKFYNARTLCENDEMSFIEYMKAQGDARYLEKQPAWLKEIVPTTQVNREFGIHRSADRIVEHLHGCLKSYLNQKLLVEKDENGSVIKEVLGVYQIRDPMLLEEVAKFNEDGNFDRIIAAELAVALAMHLDPILKETSANNDVRLEELVKRKRDGISNLFGGQKNPFPTKQTRLF